MSEVKDLEITQIVEMFPGFEKDIIKDIFLQNNGDQNLTIAMLLEMSNPVD
jgi:hypothetical protein